MYTDTNYKTKKALKEAFKEGQKIYVYQPGPFNTPNMIQGKVCIEGPHYPAPHMWYASATVENGVIVKLK